MNNINLFLYSSNLYKKTLEKFVTELKNKINILLKNNELEEAKKIIKEIEEIGKYQTEIDKVSALYIHHFESLVNETNIREENNKPKNFIHYTNEVIEIIKIAQEIKIYELKVAFFNENSEHFSTEELSMSEDYNNLLNWEIYFYKTLDLLLKRELIQYDDKRYFTVTEKGEKFYGEDFSSEEYIDEDTFVRDEEDEENKGMIELIEMKQDNDLINTLHNFIKANLIEDGYIENLSHFDKERLFVIKEIYTEDDTKINKWEEIELNKYYLISSLPGNRYKLFLIKEKIEEYKVLNCIDENEVYAYLLFI